MKKGFTLIELLAVLIILSIISLIVFPTIISLNKNDMNNEELYNTIYMACESYVMSNYVNYSTLDNVGSSAKVSILTLINDNYLKQDITNPKTNSSFTQDDYVIITRNKDMTFSYKLEG